MKKGSKDNIKAAIYEIDKSLFPGKSNDVITKAIIDEFNVKVPTSSQFKEQQLKQMFNMEKFQVKIFYQEKKIHPKWKDFLRPVLEDTSDLLKGINYVVSYIAFLYKGANIYALSGGLGNYVVQEYINQNFGIEIISRLIREDSRVIKSLQDRGLTGAIFSSTKIFRSDYRLIDEDEFGKIYKQIMAELGVETLSEHFGFTAEEIRRKVGCVAKSSFQLNKAINFTRLLDILQRVDTLSENTPKLILNKARLLNRRSKKDKELIKQLENRIFDRLYQFYKEEIDILDFEFCDSHEAEDYLKADNYKVFLGQSKKELFEEDFKLNDVTELLSRLKLIDHFALVNGEEFRKNIAALRIESFDSDGKPLTSGRFFSHLHGEIEYDSKPYFHIDDGWYQIETDFINDLNKNCQDILKDALDNTILTLKWKSDSEDENTYNQKYFKESDCLILDKIIAENIELCDILKYDNDNCYLVHVKKGFDNSLRDLTIQIAISARRLMEDLKSTKHLYFVEEIYKQLINKKKSVDPYFKSAGTQADKISLENFRSLFNKRNIHFCLAFVDTANKERSIEKDISEFKSNVAKYSLLELNKKLIGLSRNLTFKVTQINREMP